MAKRSTKVAGTKPKQVTGDSSSGRPYEPSIVMLFSFSAEQVPPPKEAGESELDYEADLTDPELDGEDHYCNVTFECRRSPGVGRSSVLVKANYGILFRGVIGNPRDTAKEIAQTIAWTKFVELVSMTNGQLRARLPELPQIARMG